MNEDVNCLHAEQQLYLSSSERLSKGARQEGQSAATRGMTRLKSEIGELSETVRRRAGENERVLKSIEDEKGLIAELSDIFKRMKIEILENRRECGRTRKELVVGDNQIQQLKQRRDKYVFPYLKTRSA